MTTRAGVGSLLVKILNAVVLAKSGAGAWGRSSETSAFSLRAYASIGRICQAYSVSPSGVWRLKGVTWFFAKPNRGGLFKSSKKRVLNLYAYKALMSSDVDANLNCYQPTYNLCIAGVNKTPSSAAYMPPATAMPSAALLSNVVAEFGGILSCPLIGSLEQLHADSCT